MPWTVEKHSSCPASRPWGVINQTNGHVDGCHPTKARARQQQKALYASERRMSGKQLTAALHDATASAEREHLPALKAAYQQALIDAGRRASQQFSLTAAADWQPPAEGAGLTAAQMAALSASLNRKLNPIWTRIVLQVAREPLARIEIAWDVKHPLAQGLLEQAAQRTGPRFGEASQFILRKTIGDAYDRGLDVRETSRLIRASMSDAAPWQAEMLARSDLNSLANGSSKAAARLTGIAYMTWDATLDAVTRPTHAEAHGQTVPIDGVFIVGGEEAQYPGDPALSDAEACNCRCTLIYGDTIEEAAGLLADGGSNIMAVKSRQRKRKQSRRAANGKLSVAAQRGLELGEALVAGAVAVHHTGVVSGTWDGNAAMGRCGSAADFRSICAAYDNGADLSLRQSWHLPHHANPGGPANINGVRNALGRAPQTTSISAADRAGATTHLRAHLNDFNRSQGNNAIEGFDALSVEDALSALEDVLGPIDIASNRRTNAMIAAPRSISFSGVAAIEGKVSDDNTIAPRVLLPDSLSWPEMPVSFMAQTVTGEGHDGAEVAGRIDEFSRKRGTGKMRNIQFGGELTTPFGINEIAPMIEDETMRYVSADLGATEWSLVNRNTLDVVPDSEFDMQTAQEGGYALGLTSGKIKAVTLVPTQAIEGALVALTAAAAEQGIGMMAQDDDLLVVVPLESLSLDREALVAAATPKRPPREWFETPEPPGKMPLTVTNEGRVYGHLATWDSCHASFLPSCIPPPRSPSNYARFHCAELDTDEGETVTVGKLMFSPSNGGHADRKLSASKASAYYDKTGMAAAYLHVIDGTYGIWAVGSINPDLNDEQREEMRRQMRLNPPSGDWRVYDGQYDLLCGLCVAVPGFAVPRAEVSLLASGDEVELMDAIIASSGLIEPDPAALAALEQIGLVDEDLVAERQMHVLAARAEGLDSLAALID